MLLRGTNVSGRHKQPPHVLPATEPVLAPLRAFGFNAVRLVVPWEAIEPEPDHYDDAYLDRLAALAAAAGEHGLHVILDMHQDLYSRAFGGSGAPAWSIAPADRGPLAPEDEHWFLRYANSAAVRRSLARFFRDEDGLQEHFDAVRRFRLRFTPRGAGDALVHLPRRHYGEDAARIEVRLSAGSFALDLKNEVLLVQAPPGPSPVEVEVRPGAPAR